MASNLKSDVADDDSKSVDLQKDTTQYANIDSNSESNASGTNAMIGVDNDTDNQPIIYEPDTQSVHSGADTASNSAAMDTLSVSSKKSVTNDATSVRSLSSTNSIIQGVLCTPCLRRSESVAAVKYCVDCVENYCKPCLRRHIKSNATKTHKLVGRDEMPDFTTPSSRSGIGIEKCSKHSDLDLDNYCEQHKTLCCDKCAYLEHGSCDHIRDLITASREIELKTEITGIQERLTLLADKLTTSRNNRQADQIRMRKNTANSLSVIREFRKNMIDVLDKLQRVPIDVINSTCLMEDNQVNDDVRDANNVLEQLQESNKKLRHDTCSDITKFAILIKSKEVERNAEECQKALSKKHGKDMNIFIVNKRVEDLIRNIKSIGDFKTVVGNIQIDFLGYFNVGSSDVDKDTKAVSNDADNDDNNAESNSKTTMCDIQGITQLADGRIVVVDFERKHLKVFSLEFVFEREVRLGRDPKDGSEPFGICRVGAFQVAITLTRDKLVNVIDLQDTSADPPLRTVVDVGEYCRGVAYSFLYDELFVVCGGGSYMDEGLGHVRVFDLQGNHLRSLKRSSTTGNLLLPHPLNIAVSQDGTTLYVTDRDKGIATLDRSGEHVTYLCCRELRAPVGICVDTAGRVIVTCDQSHSLIQIAMDGKSFNVLATESVLPQPPMAVCFDEKKSRVIVSMATKEELVVFNIH